MSSKKTLGQYFTPPDVAATLTKWVARGSSDRLLDPSCGDGAFLVHHPNAVGVEFSESVANLAKRRVPGASVYQSDFFEWASSSIERFDAVLGNPPFIRYQNFNGATRQLALTLARRQGAEFSGLSSSWAPFLVAASGLLKPGGRMAFVTPAEIGHATYARPLLKFLMSHFGFIVIVAIRDKLFPQLSEDAWLVYADGFGERSSRIGLAIRTRFSAGAAPPRPDRWISAESLQQHNFKLRRNILSPDIVAHYDELCASPGVVRLDSLARVGIGYVSGDNDFFHLRPSTVDELNIPKATLRVAVRNGSQLQGRTVNDAVVRRWIKDDHRIMLLDLARVDSLPASIVRYLDSPDGQRARDRYKCRVRNPWYAVPNVCSPDAFLTYLNGRQAHLITNKAKCVCTNSLLTVHLKGPASAHRMRSAWAHLLSRLSQELEGHPLGGGMLKLEPGEAARVRLPLTTLRKMNRRLLEDGIAIMRRWRHHK